MLYTGSVHTVGEHIDTDAIIPARFLVTSDPKILGSHCMAGLAEDWIARVHEGDILVAGRNFGCGSSREHAPIALLGAGIPLVIGHSFARIFYRNAFNMGLPLFEIGDQVQAFHEGDVISVDTDTGIITNQTRSATIQCPPIPASMAKILAAQGLVGYVKKRLASQA
ncbi:MAG: 3-isopropylmalate dehydratase small subunit [Desulfovibrio sp.]|nr:3-isopropylmalate dehydratase small subunit [Desulfovibrio sp.]